MLLLDVPRICADKGIPNAKKFLLGLGFYPKAAADIIKRKRVRIDYDQIEKLCLALRCTPNDLFSWQPNKDTQVDAQHPMHELVRKQSASIPEMLQSMSAAEIEEMRQLLEARRQSA
jgi:DNA-binding Xre family transcriptional regulator